jgi:putative hemolysin
MFHFSKLNPFWSAFLLLCACTPVFVLGPTGKKASESTLPTTGLANPASTHCTQNQGQLQIRQTAGGQAGYCYFNDRSYCEEWAYYKGECKPGQQFTTFSR